MTAGISYEVENFDIVMGYFDPNSCQAEICSQMLGRIRNVKEKTYYICVPKMDCKKEIYIPNYYNDIEEKLQKIDKRYKLSEDSLSVFMRNIQSINKNKENYSKHYLIR